MVMFQSTLPMKGATHIPNPFMDSAGVSIHAPNEGSDLDQAFDMDKPPKFQSTLPMKGATSRRLGSVAAQWFQSTLPMKGATTNGSPPLYRSALVSIHAPNEGSDHC